MGAFYVRHERAVLTYFLRRTRDPETAADLAAETFAAVLLRLRRGAEVDEPLAWLFTIAHGRFVDFQRRGRVAEKARRRLGLERIEWTDAELERVAELGAPGPAEVALAGLATTERTALEAHVLGEQPYSVIAAAYGISEAAVRQRVSRGLRRLRTRLGRETS